LAARIAWSLELRRAAFQTGDYVDDRTTEVAYLSAHGVSLARLHYSDDSLPTLSSGHLHVLFELPDHLGSSSIVIDKETSELVERSTYLAKGSAESDYRPERWDSFREDHRFTGKEEDIEVGLTYFGARYYAPGLGRFVSPDPEAIHGLGADANVYAYVSGRLLSSVDPLGLDSLPGGAPPQDGGNSNGAAGADGYIDPDVPKPPIDGERSGKAEQLAGDAPATPPPPRAQPTAAQTITHAAGTMASGTIHRDPTLRLGAGLWSLGTDALASEHPGQTLSDRLGGISTGLGAVQTPILTMGRIAVQEAISPDSATTVSEEEDTGIAQGVGIGGDAAVTALGLGEGSVVGAAVREDAEPVVQALQRPPNGRAVFDGLEVRGMRDLAHVPDSTLRAQAELGFASKDAQGRALVLHHHEQNAAGPIIEMPATKHSIGNPRQHPFGNAKGSGLTADERDAFNVWRVEYWKARARGELQRRGSE
jgi:RHS repeat-associated protein